MKCPKCGQRSHDPDGAWTEALGLASIVAFGLGLAVLLGRGGWLLAGLAFS